MITSRSSDPLFDGRCEVCKTHQHENWIVVAPYEWKHPVSGAVIERRGIAVCIHCETEAKEHRCV